MLAASQYKEYLRGKNVVLVGPAYSLKGREQGKLIDSFNVVARVSEPMHVISETEQNCYGSRMNVVYLPPSLSKIMKRRRGRTTRWAENKRFTRQDVSEVVCRWQKMGIKWAITRTCQLKYHQFNSLRIPKQWVNGVRQKTSCSLRSTGVLATIHLLEYPIKSLYVTGFDFYQTGYFYDKNQWEIGRPKIGKENDPHLQYYKKLYLKDNRFTVDEKLREIFKNVN